MVFKFVSAVICMGFLPVAAWAQIPHPQSAQKAEAKTLEEFQQWAKEFVVEPKANVRLPEGWFQSQFDGELGEKLAAEYAEFAKHIDGLALIIAAQKAKGQTELSASVCQKAIDRDATGLQNAAMQRMKSPTPLFTLRMVKPGEQRGFTLASFVFVEGRFCFAGKMSALNPHPGDLVTSILCTTPLSMMEKVLQDRGLLEGTAEAHLKKVGVLK